MKSSWLRLAVIAALLIVLAPLARLHASAEGEDLRAADAELNAAYQKALAAMPTGDAKEKLRAAQRAWVVFRDAELELNGELPGASGNTLKMLQTNLTELRTKQLQLIAKGELSDTSGE